MKIKLKILYSSILLIGIGFLAYSPICNLIQKSYNTSLIENYENNVDKMNTEQKNELIKAVESYNENLKNNKVQTVDSDMLSISGFIGYIEIPKSDIYLPIYNSTSDYVLENGIGHLEQTSLPYGGKSTHSVLTGHTGMAENKLFTNIDKLVIGDIFYIHILGEIHAYRVDKIKTVLPEEIKESDFKISNGKDYITLMTCTPYGINSHRLLIRGIRIPYSDEPADNSSVESNNEKIVAQKPTTVSEHKENAYKTYFCIIAIISVVLISLALVISIIKIRKLKKEENHNAS